MNKQFWMVWNEYGRPPMYRHDTRESADTEAKRLASAHPGGSFYVFEAVAHARKSDVVFTNLQTGDQAPF